MITLDEHDWKLVRLALIKLSRSARSLTVRRMSIELIRKHDDGTDEIMRLIDETKKTEAGSQAEPREDAEGDRRE